MAYADYLVSLGLNVVGGALVAGGMETRAYLRKRWRRRAFKSIFGLDAVGEMCVIYESFVPPNRGTVFNKAPGRVLRATSAAKNLTSVAPGAGVRGATHIGYAIGRDGIGTAVIQADDVDDDRMDISFVSIGGLNHRSSDLLDDANNVFLKFRQNNIVAKLSGALLIREETLATGLDYGFIVKIHPAQNERRTWICCAGLGEWGSSGPAWYLAHHWRDIYRKVGDEPFACVTKTRFGSDDSTVHVITFTTPEEIERAAQNPGILLPE